MLRTDEGELVLAASDATDQLACSHLFTQKLAIARRERSHPKPVDDPYVELIQARGDEHEREQLGLLAGELGGFVDLSGEPFPRTEAALRAAARRTEEAMGAGTPLIFQATFYDGRWQGRVDFLRRVSVPSELGEFSYEVIDTKLARAVKPQTVHQLLLYSRLLARVQGHEPAQAHVILGDGAREIVDLRRYRALHRHLSRRIEAMSAAPTPASVPEPVAHCAICRFGWECRDWFREVDHLSLVAGATRMRRDRLADIDLETMSALAAAAADLGPGRLGDAPFELLRNQAMLQVESARSGEPTRRHLPPQRAAGYAALPEPSSRDVFFDLEGDPFLGDDGIEYLWGWSSSDGGYEVLWAHEPAEEKAALERFVDEIGRRRSLDPTMHVYHYAPHERSKLRSLSVKYATREAEVDELLRRGVLVDLLAVVRAALQVGEESYSLKRLERHHGYERQNLEVREGGGSIVVYERWLELRREEMLESIRAYNEDDCRSTASLRDWLCSEMRPEAARELGVDFADLTDPDPTAEHGQPKWLPGVVELADSLLDGLDPDASTDDPERARRRLVSHLLLYHHREAKPEWWRYFDLRERSLEELHWERDAVAGLELDRSLPPREYKKSLDYTLRFPDQEVKLSPGEVEDPTDENRTYNLIAIEGRTLTLRRGKDKPPPEPRALAGGSPVSPKSMREALIEVGEAVRDGREIGAVGKLLDREPPGLPAEALGESVEELIEAMLALDVAVLPIQGPPGTGKTYRGARMIVAALASGLRVGVSAQSHAAIQNLLGEVEVVARDWPLDFSGAYKCDRGWEGPVGTIECVSNKGVSTEHQLVGGTAWLFTRSEHRGKFDLLFIDEAGQYSLANAAGAGLCARSLVLLGDPQQLPQVTQAEHPFGAGASVLEHLLDGASTIPAGRGVLLTQSWRMHPDVCAFVSERSYERKLQSEPGCGLRAIDSEGPLSGAGLRTLAVEHFGRSQFSPEEAEAIAAAARELLAEGAVTDSEGIRRPLEPADLMVVAPYNMAVNMIETAVPPGVRVGTVDRFQGQQAPVVFYAMTCSAGEDVPRGLDFLFDQNRMNVAVSRAQCLAVLVHSPRLLEANCSSLEAMERLDGICRFVEMAGAAGGVPAPA